MIPLTGKFHAHLTINSEIPKNIPRLLGGKLTDINLYNESKNQVDRMLTFHYITGKEYNDEFDIIENLQSKVLVLESNNVNVNRIKLEHEFLHHKSDVTQIQESISRKYVEVHIKCKLKLSNLSILNRIIYNSDWACSVNIFNKIGDEITQFVNKRFYNVVNIDNIIDDVELIKQQINNIVTIQEIKLESCIYDSNDNLDKWWA